MEYIEPGVYEYKEDGPGGWPEICVDGEWYDICLEEHVEDLYEII